MLVTLTCFSLLKGLFPMPQELRKENVKAIKRQRKAVEGEWTDSTGYDLIQVPKVQANPFFEVQCWVNS